MLWKSSHVHQSMTGTDHYYHKNALPHSYIYTQAQPGPQSAATHPITITFCAQCSSGPGYRWFILPFIKETGVPLKRDQSATRLEESASNWPFIKKPSQVDHSAEISRMITEPHYINYTTDEPPCSVARPLFFLERLENAQIHAHLDTSTRMMLW